MQIRRSTRIPTLLGASLAAATALTLAVGGPASAATSADTITTFTVSAGATALAITAPANQNLGTGAPGATITSLLGEVVVTDGRALLTPTWAVTVTSTPFVTGAGTAPETIPTSAVSYWSGPATAQTPATGMTFVPGQPASTNRVALSTSPTAFSLTAGSGSNSLTFNPTLVVSVPASAVGGLYTGTVTHSVA